MVIAAASAKEVDIPAELQPKIYEGKDRAGRKIRALVSPADVTGLRQATPLSYDQIARRTFAMDITTLDGADLETLRDRLATMNDTHRQKVSSSRGSWLIRLGQRINNFFSRTFKWATNAQLITAKLTAIDTQIAEATPLFASAAPTSTLPPSTDVSPINAFMDTEQAGDRVLIAELRETLAALDPVPTSVTPWTPDDAALTFVDFSVLIKRIETLETFLSVITGIDGADQLKEELNAQLLLLGDRLHAGEFAAADAVCDHINRQIPNLESEDNLDLIQQQLALANEVSQRLRSVESHELIALRRAFTNRASEVAVALVAPPPPPSPPSFGTAYDATFGSTTSTPSPPYTPSASPTPDYVSSWFAMSEADQMAMLMQIYALGDGGWESITCSEVLPSENVGGLTNLGNTCYLNSVIQMLRLVPDWEEQLPDTANPLTNVVSTLRDAATAADGALDRATMQTFFRACLDAGWEDILLRSMRPEQAAVARLLDADGRMQMYTGLQMDADEFFMWVTQAVGLKDPITGLHRESTQTAMNIRTSLPHLDRLNGYIDEMDGLLTERAVPLTSDTLADLIGSLDISPMYRDLLRAHFAATNPVETGRLSHATFIPAHSNEQLLQWGLDLDALQIVNEPDFFVQKIDRYTTAAVGAPKNNEPLDFTQPVTIAGQTYQAKAVVLHTGPNVSSGHYTTLYRQENGSWGYYDDSTLLAVDDPQQAAITEKAYLIMWERVPETT